MCKKKNGQILLSHSQDIERKRIVHGMTERQNDGDEITEGLDESSIAPLFQSGAIIKFYTADLRFSLN